jgi:hypothetical protein
MGKEKKGARTRCLQEIHITNKDTHRLKVRGWKKIFHTHGNQKQAYVAIHCDGSITMPNSRIEI